MVCVILAARCVAGKGGGGMNGDKRETIAGRYKNPNVMT